MLKRILPYGTIALSALLFVTAIIDLLIGSIDLFAMLFFRLTVVALILLPFGLTAFVCLQNDLRRPLLLSACLLQSALGGVLAVLTVYDLCFPAPFQMNLLIPLAVLPVALVSGIQGVVVLLGMRMDKQNASAREEARHLVDAQGPSAASEQAPISVAPPVSIPKRSAVKEKMSGQELIAAKMASRSRKASATLTDDDLAPVPKKRKRDEMPAKELTNSPAPATTVSGQPAYANLFELLEEEIELSRKNAAVIPATNQKSDTDDSAKRKGNNVPVWETELPDSVFTLPSIKREKEQAADLSGSFVSQEDPAPLSPNGEGQ